MSSADDKALSDKKDTPLRWRLQAHVAALKFKNDHIKEERDGWFASLPADLQQDFLDEEELLREAAARIEDYERLLEGVVSAWTSIPEGYHDANTIQAWLSGKMHGSVEAIRGYRERNP